jgi:uncharacterized protein (TIGR00369 family)
MCKGSPSIKHGMDGPIGDHESWLDCSHDTIGLHVSGVRITVMTVTLDDARTALRSQPFSMLLGAELTSFDSAGVELRVPITDKVTQQHGFVHGGVISYVADNALTFAGGHALGPAIVTSEYKINYLRPARGETLVARATVIHAGRSQAVCRCEVFAIAGTEWVLCAVALGTIASQGRAE